MTVLDLFWEGGELGTGALAGAFWGEGWNVLYIEHRYRRGWDIEMISSAANHRRRELGLNLQFIVRRKLVLPDKDG